MKTYYFCEWCGRFSSSLKRIKNCEKRHLSIGPYFGKLKFGRTETVEWKNQRWTVLKVYRKHYKLVMSRVSAQKDNQGETCSLKFRDVGSIKFPISVHLVAYNFDSKLDTHGQIAANERHFVYKIQLESKDPEDIKYLESCGVRAVSLVSGEYLRYPWH